MLFRSVFLSTPIIIAQAPIYTRVCVPRTTSNLKLNSEHKEQKKEIRGRICDPRIDEPWYES